MNFTRVYRRKRPQDVRMGDDAAHPTSADRHEPDDHDRPENGPTAAVP